MITQVGKEKIVDIERWIVAAGSNPREIRRRQVVHIIFNAIARAEDLRDVLFLKGGTLLTMAYGSRRATADVDFTTSATVDEFGAEFTKVLNREMEISANLLGYLEIACNVQGATLQPKRLDAQFPSLEVRIASADRRSGELRRLERGQATHVTRLEISFYEYIEESQQLKFGLSGQFILAYTLNELLAEKYRALLQQVQRNRFRRQDVYDISRIVGPHKFDHDGKAMILHLLIAKGKARALEVSSESIDEPEIALRARTDYDTLEMEIGEEKLDFDTDFEIVRKFYRSLPWNGLATSKH